MCSSEKEGKGGGGAAAVEAAASAELPLSGSSGYLVGRCESPPSSLPRGHRREALLCLKSLFASVSGDSLERFSEQR